MTREELITFIMEHNFRDDDPKNDDSNRRYLESLAIEQLIDLKADYIE